MSRQGYERASVAAIAAEAGLVPGLVHYHFQSKLDILVALVDLLRERLAARIQACLAAAGDGGPRTRLGAFLDAHVATGPGADPRAVACWVSVAAEAIREPEVRAVYQRVVEAALDELSGLVSAVFASEGRRIAGLEARAMAASLYAAIQGAYQLATAAPDATPKGFAAPALHRLAEALLGPAPVRKRARG